MFLRCNGVAGDQNRVPWLGEQEAAGAGRDAREWKDVDARCDGVFGWKDSVENRQAVLQWSDASVLGVLLCELQCFAECGLSRGDFHIEGEPGCRGKGSNAAHGVVGETRQEYMRDLCRLDRGSLCQLCRDDLWRQAWIYDEVDGIPLNQRGCGVAGSNGRTLVPERVGWQGSDGNDAGGWNHGRNGTAPAWGQGEWRRYAFWMKRKLLAACVLGSLGLAAPAQRSEPLPWFLKLGETSMQLRARVPVSQQVVLVPDLATLIDEVGKWTPEAHWPVLFDDAFFAPMFIRRFAPKVIFRRSSVGPPPSDSAAIAAAITSAASKAWGGAAQSPREAATAAGLPAPAGLVISDPADPAVSAALLLAAGRGQDIAWISGNFGKPDGVLGQSDTASLVQHIQDAAVATGLSWDQLGDEIDTLSVCRTMSARAKTAAPVAMSAKAGEPMAMTDIIGRTSEGRRWAVAGWIFGDTARAAWMANCSLFLPRVNAWLCGTYPAQLPWLNWSVAPAASALEQETYKVTLLEHETLPALRADSMRGVQADLAVMTSKGNADFFRMADDQDADPGGVPILDSPAALYMIHSWSLRSPESLESVGGRWLSRGVYAYVGSSAEPQLQAFVPPSLLVKRIAGGVPLLVASRWWPATDNPMSRIWRINTLGDPLMIAPHPKGSLRRMVTPVDAPQRSGVVDIQTEAVTSMREAEKAPSDTAFGQAISAVVLLGKDEIAGKLWEAAAAKQVNGPQSARAVFGSLFRLGEHVMLLEAWQKLEGPSALEGDMLWASLGPLLGDGTSEAALAALSEAISPGAVVQRILRIAPEMGRRYGGGAERAMLDRGIAMATTSRQRQVLTRALKKLTN